MSDVLGQSIRGIRIKESSYLERNNDQSGYHLPTFKSSPQAYVSKRKSKLNYPKLSELDVIRHYTRLSQFNYGIDLGMYPLGSCTMKYNPRINEEVAAIENFRYSHPLAPPAHIQGSLEVIYNLEGIFKEITGLQGISLQPAAGAHGEFTGIKLIRAYHKHHGMNEKDELLIPDSAHGTNPASASIAGFKVVKIPSNAKGIIHPDDVRKCITNRTAGIMITVPNTLGIFETHIKEISNMLHEVNAFVYMDGANFNALVGLIRPGDIGVDVMHFNLHKTFSTPHGGGGPGSGPIACCDKLYEFLPNPKIIKNGNEFSLSTYSHSIGRVRAGFGNFGIFLRAYCYILSFGNEYLPELSKTSIQNATYIRKKLEPYYNLPYKTQTMHECVFNDKIQNGKDVKTMDIAKRLIDYGFHPMTVYFPLVVPGAMMIEPTESEPLFEIKEFIDAMISIAKEVEEGKAEILKSAPSRTRITKVNEVQAVKQPVLKY